MNSSSRSPATALPRRQRRARLGLTLVEVMISLGILALTSVGGVSAFVLLNRYASNSRNVTAAKELCQERIEQALALPYNPLKNTPSLAGQTVNGAATGPYNILGIAYADASGNALPGANYNSNGVLNSTATVTTSTEPVNIYLKQETGTNIVSGTRSTTIGLPTGLKDVTKGTQLPIVQFTVTVAYSFRGQNYSYSMYILRGAD